MELENRIAVITAAGSGIGQAGAKRLAREGARVVVTDYDGARARETAEAIVEAGGWAEAHALDVGDSNAVRDLIQDVIQRHHRIDILHNHAGIQTGGGLEAITPAQFDESWHINVRAQMYACQQVMPQMKQQGGGVILNTASNAGVFIDTGMLAYITTKSAVITMTKQIAVDYGRYNIRVNALCPGWVDTPFNAAYIEKLGGHDKLETLVTGTVPMGRFCKLEEMAEAILFLVSDRSSFITGHALVVDGGEAIAFGTNSVP